MAIPSAQSLLRANARNNALANYRLHAACAQLAPAELHARRTSFFPTIMMTLNHILIVDWYYLDALTRGGRGRATLEPEEPFAEVAPLTAAQRAADLALLQLVEGLSEADLAADTSIERADHAQHEQTLDVLLHLFHHQTHHRGQVHAMLAGTAVPPPQLDEFFLREELPLRSAELRALDLPLA